jgi:putative DNA primase/helicase
VDRLEIEAMSNLANQPPEGNESNQAEQAERRPNYDRWLGDPRFRNDTFPLVHGEKYPAVKWSTWKATKKEWESFRSRGCGVALKTRRYNIIDGDINNAPIAKVVKEAVFGVLDPTPPERFRDGSSRFSLLCQLAEGEPPLTKQTLSFKDPDGVEHKLEWLASGQYAFVEGVHPSGQVLEWRCKGTSCAFGLPDPPRVTAKKRGEVFEAVTAKLKEMGCTDIRLSGSGSVGSGGKKVGDDPSLLAPNAQAVFDLLDAARNTADNFPRRDDIVDWAHGLAGALGQEFGQYKGEIAEWLAEYEGFKQEEIEKLLDSITTSRIGWSWLQEKARVLVGYGVQEDFDDDGALTTAEIGKPPTDLEMLPVESEDVMARTLAMRHAHHLRYVKPWDSWMYFDGQRWHKETTLLVYDYVRRVCRENAARVAANNKSLAKVLTAGRTIAAVEKLARSDRLLVATVDQWDLDTSLANTPCGTVDLKTGQARPAHPEDYCTQRTAVAPAETSECPLWLRFLNRIMNGDTELVAFLQRMCGYILTGLTREHAMFFLHGPTGTGKGTFVETVKAIFGDYGKAASVSTFVEAPFEQHSTDIAGLKGARLVIASETKEGQRWNEAKVKMLTGGDTVRARFMRQDFFEYVPQFKLLIMSNEKPALRNVGEAMQRRLHLIPFSVKITEQERDTKLPEKLRAEWPGILRWMIEGCLKWQQQGLAPPDVVRAATADYFASEDMVGNWIEDRCERDPQAWCSRDQLFASWVDWAMTAKEPIGTRKQFLETLRDRGFGEMWRKDVRGFVGLKLRPQEPQVVDEEW